MNAYGLDVPVGISNKPFVYAFIDVVIRMASVVKHRFGLTSQKAALFVLYSLQHLPFFNLQTDFRNIKTSKLWPALINKDDQMSVAVAPGPFVSFIITSSRHNGPLDYKGWTSADCPKKLAPFNSPKSFRRDARKRLRLLNQWCKSLLKSFLHFHNHNRYLFHANRRLSEAF